MLCQSTHRQHAWPFLLAGVLLVPEPLAGAQTDIVGPPGSVAFGTAVAVLPNGNIVVTDPVAGAASQGAVHLYSSSGALISTLTGGHPNDLIGVGGITVLANGNYVISSPVWNLDAGAVTWGDADGGVAGVVSSANSLVGSVSGHQVGMGGVTALGNGNYVVSSRYWDDGEISDVGAVTWGDGDGGTAGVVSAANSLVGTSDDDQVGIGGAVALPNGHYLVLSYAWDDGAVPDVGAVTWSDGASVLNGTISPANSLTGTAMDDRVGEGGVTVLANGNYVVRSPNWTNGAVKAAGAATWASGAGGMTGVVSAANSLVGSTGDDRVGISGVTALANGHYVVTSEFWNNGLAENAGAATWGNGDSGTTGVVSTANSLTGSSLTDLVGAGGTVALANGHYVVVSPYWFNPSPAAVNAGAVSWGDGQTGSAGAVSAANSLVGLAAEDRVGQGGVAALSGGNYAVASPAWDNGVIANAGAVTWGNGASGIAGAVSAANSLVGTSAGDQVGSGCLTALANGHYVVCSPLWDLAAAADAGAATWRDGAAANPGALSAALSLTGTQAGDRVGIGGARALANGHYVVRSYHWANGGAVAAGAVTWQYGAEAFTGTVSASNSLVGSLDNDQVGYDVVVAFADGNYVVHSWIWDNGGIADGGAVTPADGSYGASGPVQAQNSVLGTAEFTGDSMVFGYDPARRQFAVGRPASNLVTLITVPTQLIFADGFE